MVHGFGSPKRKRTRRVRALATQYRRLAHQRELVGLAQRAVLVGTAAKVVALAVFANRARQTVIRGEEGDNPIANGSASAIPEGFPCVFAGISCRNRCPTSRGHMSWPATADAKLGGHRVPRRTGFSP